MNNQDPLYKNKFIKQLDTEDLPQNTVQEYRKYYEDQTENIKKKKVINRKFNVPETNQNPQQNFLPQNKSNKFNGTSMGESSSFINNESKNYIEYDQVKVTAIDSTHRDIYSYPNANNFTWTFEEEYTNVKKIELISTEIPNTDQTIKNTPIELANNVISWINYEDKDLNIFTNVIINTIVSNTIDIFIPNTFILNSKVDILIFNSKLDSSSNITGFIDSYYQATVIDSNTLRIYYTNGISGQGTCSIDLGYPVYSVSLIPGNYDATELITQMQSSLNLVKRRNGTGIYHYYNITLNLATNVITLESVITTTLQTNPISTTANSTIITVSSLNHGFKTGDIVLMIGINNIAGITSNILNGDYSITVIDFNTFQYEINIAASSTTTGGGNNVKTGKQAPYKLLFATAKTLIQYNIGFNNEDSSEYINSVNPITTKSLSIINAVILNPNTIRITTDLNHQLFQSTTLNIINISAGNPVVITTLTPHNIQLPTIIRLRDTNSNPSIDGDIFAYPSGPYTFFTQSRTTLQGGNRGSFVYGGDQVRIRNLATVPTLFDVTEFSVINIPNLNQIDINFQATAIDSTSFSNSFVDTSQIVVNHPNHNFNILIGITSINNIYTNIKTQLNNNYTGMTEDLIPIIPGPLNTNTVDILFTQHGLTTSDVITIKNSTTIPVIDGIYKVQVISLNELRINFVNSGITPGTAKIISGDTITITNSNSLPKIDGTFHIRNRILISNISIGTSSTIITTNSSNYWQIGDTITISQSTSVPNIDGVYTIQSVIDQFNFVINIVFPVVSAGISGIVQNNNTLQIQTGFLITNSGTSGLLQRNLDVILYRIAPDTINGNSIGGILLSNLNGVSFPIIKIIDKNNYMIRIHQSYANKSVTAGGSNVYTSSLNSGWKSQQANTVSGSSTDGTLLARAINLAGEPYILLISPTLNNNSTFKVSGTVKNVLGKILLKDSPGYMNYDGFITSPTIFNPSLNKLSAMNFQLVNKNGYAYNLANLPYSFSLRITQEHKQLINTYENTRTK